MHFCVWSAYDIRNAEINTNFMGSCSKVFHRYNSNYYHLVCRKSLHRDSENEEARNILKIYKWGRGGGHNLEKGPLNDRQDTSLVRGVRGHPENFKIWRLQNFYLVRFGGYFK